MVWKESSIFLVVLMVATAMEYAEEWEAWKMHHAKQYISAEEELQRLSIWMANKKFVEQHNARAAEHGFTLTMNKFADLEVTEFAELFLSHSQAAEAKVKTNFARNSTLPSSVDWRNKGYVTAVKDQGQCGSCWAFSTTGSLEGQHFKATGKLVSLSEQNLMDCMQRSCKEGGDVGKAFHYIQSNGGINSEESYPYLGRDAAGGCRYNPANFGATLTDWVYIEEGNEEDLQAATATVGPISVSIDAGQRTFQLYEKGVYFSSRCYSSISRLDHSVLVVGYNQTSAADYWIVKNSWGADWGMDGYIAMSRNKNNNCGIATDALYPIV